MTTLCGVCVELCGEMCGEKSQKHQQNQHCAACAVISRGGAQAWACVRAGARMCAPAHLPAHAAHAAHALHINNLRSRYAAHITAQRTRTPHTHARAPISPSFFF